MLSTGKFAVRHHQGQRDHLIDVKGHYSAQDGEVQWKLLTVVEKNGPYPRHLTFPSDEAVEESVIVKIING